MSKIFNISSLDKSLGRIFSDFRNSNFKAHLLSLIEQIWELIWKFHLKSLVWHIKIDSLTALWIKWRQKEEKILPANFQPNWVVLGAHFKVSYSIYQNWSFLELFVSTVLSVSGLAAFIRVRYFIYFLLHLFLLSLYF